MWLFCASVSPWASRSTPWYVKPAGDGSGRSGKSARPTLPLSTAQFAPSAATSASADIAEAFEPCAFPNARR